MSSKTYRGKKEVCHSIKGVISGWYVPDLTPMPSGTVLFIAMHPWVYEGASGFL